MTIHIALVGDYDATVVAHQAIPKALQISAQQLGVEVQSHWIHTSTIEDSAQQVSEYAGIWCVPASPYANMAGALAAIRFARQINRPFLGTCGGFQHAVLEYVRNKLGYTQADHAETAPDAEMPIIARLSCSLVEKNALLFFREGSQLQTIYGTDQAEEQYHCNYGLNPNYNNLFSDPNGLQIAATDVNGEIRAIELPYHPFFFATLFQPERSSLQNRPHPLITAFVAMTKH